MKNPKSDAEKLADAVKELAEELKRYNDAKTPAKQRPRSEPELYRADYDPASREERETAEALRALPGA